MKQLRLILLIILVSFTIAANAVIQSGSCGKNVTFVLNDDGTLVISGTSEMYNYTTNTDTPWRRYISKVIKVIIEDGVTSIGDNAFWQCENLTSVSIHNSVLSIGKFAFSGCKSLHSINIPTSVTEVGNNAFYDCSALPIHDNIRYADTYLVEVIDKSCISANIKDGTKWIGDAAFYECINLISIEIPNTVINIEDEVFTGCSNLTFVTIPNTVPTIGNWTFAGCYKLESIIIPNSVKKIGEQAFRYCTNLATVVIGDNVSNIGPRAFEHCEALSSLIIGKTVNVIGWNAFAGCYKLESIIIPNSVKEIGCGAFASCKSLTSVTIPSSISRIENQTFFGCSNLREVTLPRSIIYIDCDAYKNCECLNHFTCKATTVPFTDSSAFDNVNCQDGTLCVPQEAKIDYASTLPWSKWGNIKGEVYRATGISFDKQNIKLHEGDKETLIATITPGDAKEKGVTWKSDDSTIASVVNGIVTAHKVGKTIITATTIDGSNLSTSCEVVVEPILATSVSLSETSRTLNVGEHFTLSTTVLPTNATSKDVYWNSSNNSVASVSNGVVTAISSGNTTITAKATDGSGCSATCIVNVNKSQQSISWSQDLTTLCVDGEMVELDATSSSGLPVTYKIADESIASYFDMGLKKYINPNKEGTTTITARQEGNDKYYPIEITKTVVVQASTEITKPAVDNSVYQVYRINGVKVGAFTPKEYKDLLSQKKLAEGLYIVNGVKVQIK